MNKRKVHLNFCEYHPADLARLEIREEDKRWCRMRGKSPEGVIVKVEDVFKPLIYLGKVGGAIIRSKRIGKSMLLQVVHTSGKKHEYVITNTLDTNENHPNRINVQRLN